MYFWPGPFEVSAFNSARDSENKMHDDTVAKTLGFAGGLVPGVDVFGYLSHVPLEAWGRAFLERGVLEGYLLKPVYENDLVTVSSRPVEGNFELVAESKGIVVSTGFARLPNAPPQIALKDYLPATPPAEDERPTAGADTYAIGEWLGMWPRSFTTKALQDHLVSVRETNPIYAEEGIVHPGSLCRLCNFTLMQNARLGPWIHVSSKAQMLSLARVGDELTVRARVANNYQRRHRRFVELDALIVANNDRAVAQFDHVAIYMT